MEEDNYYMSLAIAVARVGMSKGNSPFGAVIVDANGTVLACGHNQVLETGDPTAHGEIVTIRKAVKDTYLPSFHNVTDMEGKVVGTVYDKPGGMFLDGCTIYSTGEPCPMCFGAIHWAKIKRIVYGVGIPFIKTHGFDELLLDNSTLKELSKSDIIIDKSNMANELLRLFNDWKNKIGVTY